MKGGCSKVSKLIRILAIVAISTIGVLWATPAFAYGPNAPGLGLTLSVVTPGASITISGSSFQPGETVTIVLHSFPATLGTTTADPSGNSSATVTIPSDTPPGNHTITATGNTSGTTVSVGIVVVGSSTAGSSTGTSSGTPGSSSGGPWRSRVPTSQQLPASGLSPLHLVECSCSQDDVGGGRPAKGPRLTNTRGSGSGNARSMT